MTYPCVYALLKGRSEIDYNKFLDEVLDLMPHGVTPNPLSIMTDFELAAIKAFKSNFPLAETSGCYFHLGQSVWRKIQKIGNGLPQKYMNDAIFALQVMTFFGIGICPSDRSPQIYATAASG